MSGAYTESPVSLTGHLILRILVSFPIACFIGALMTDIAYALTANMTWADFSAWLLAVGLLTGVLAAIGGIVDIIANHRTRPIRQTWLLVIASFAALVLGAVNNMVHSRDAWTSVMPTGLILSAATVIVLLAAAWFSAVTPHAGAR